MSQKTPADTRGAASVGTPDPPAGPVDGDASLSDAPPRPREARVAKVRPGVEAILFSSPRPVSERDLAGVLEATPDAIAGALAQLAADAEVPERGVRLERVGGGWRYVTRPEFDGLLRRFHDVSERSRLSLAALETLAIIAYRQPITLPEVQEIRGVNSASVLKTLFEKKLITTAGRKAVVGTPFLYRTTPDFLVRFGLNELEELPRPEEIEEDLASTVGDPAAAPTEAASRPPRTAGGEAGGGEGAPEEDDDDGDDGDEGDGEDEE